MEQLEKAQVCADPERRRWYLSFVVVGGGFSGVEVAGEINDLVRDSLRFYDNLTAEEVRVTLVHARSQILPEVSSSLREFARVKMEEAGIHVVLNSRVVSATPEGVEVEGGRMIHGATLVCTIGTTMLPLVQRLDVPKEAGRLPTDPDMRLRAASNVWAIGDCARVVNAYDNHPSPTTGQLAERQGRQVAENIMRVLKGQPTKPFFYKPLGQLCGIGAHNAVAEVLGVCLSGVPAWILWRTVYLLKYPSWSRRIKVAFDWTWELLFSRELACPRVNQTERVARAHYRPGDYLFHQGEPATNFYVLEQGEVEAIRRDTTGQLTTMTVFGPGDFFGEIALLNGGTHIGSVRARTAVEVCVMGKEVFSRVFGAFTPFRGVLAQSLRWRRPRVNPRLAGIWAALERRPLSTFIDEIPEHRLSPDDTFDHAVRTFDQHGVEFLCVVNEVGSLQGLITKNELLEAFGLVSTTTTKVRDFMQSDPIMVTPDDTSLQSGDLMSKHNLDWLPVVENRDSRRLIGVLRSKRMLRYLVSSIKDEAAG